jgi:hypothetical protein
MWYFRKIRILMNYRTKNMVKGWYLDEKRAKTIELHPKLGQVKIEEFLARRKVGSLVDI